MTSRLGKKLSRGAKQAYGLTGNCDFILEYALEPGTVGYQGIPMPAPLPGSGPLNNVADDAPQLLPTALEEQLGLNLKPVRGALDVMVIDHAEPVRDQN